MSAGAYLSSSMRGTSLASPSIMRCADVMTKSPVVVRASDPLAVVNRTMKTSNLVFLPVCDEKGAVVGFVTEQHLTRLVVEQDLGPSTAVEAVMGRDVSTCAPDDDLSVAARAVADHPGRCAVCLGANGEPIGVIGVTDIARARASAATDT